MSAEPRANFMPPISMVTRRNSSARRPSLRAFEAKRSSYLFVRSVSRARSVCIRFSAWS